MHKGCIFVRSIFERHVLQGVLSLRHVLWSNVFARHVFIGRTFAGRLQYILEIEFKWRIAQFDKFSPCSAAGGGAEPKLVVELESICRWVWIKTQAWTNSEFAKSSNRGSLDKCTVKNDDEWILRSFTKFWMVTLTF